MNAVLDAPSGSAIDGPVGRPSSWRVAAAIARVEGPRLIRHPATMVGALLSSVGVLAFLVVPGVVPVLARDVLIIAPLVVPVAAGAMLAAHLAASRLDRDEAEGLARVAPTKPVTRTGGLLLALAWPAAASTAWTVLVLGVLAALDGIGAPATGDVLAPSGTVVLLGALGVALGRWVPSATAGTFAFPAAALGVYAAFVAVAGTTGERLVPWADWGGLRPDVMVELWPRAPWVHLAYVLLVAGALAALALLRDQQSVSVVGLMVAAVVGAAALAVHLVSVWDDPDTLSALLEDLRSPAHRLVCAGGDGVEVCVPDGYKDWVARFEQPVTGALAQVPDGARPDELRVELLPRGTVELVSSLGGDAVAGLPPEAQAVALGPPWEQVGELPDRGVVRASFYQHRGMAGAGQHLDLALGVLAEATGFRDTARERQRRIVSALDGGPVAGQPDPDDPSRGVAEGCAPDLEAREVVTFALAAASSPVAHRALAAELDLRPYGWGDGAFDGGFFDDWFRLPWGEVTDARVYGSGMAAPWSRGAATLGLELAEAVDPEALRAEWDRWTDPATSADELVAAFGLTPLASPAQLAEEAGFADDQRFDPACV